MSEHSEQNEFVAAGLSHLLPALWRGVVKLARSADQMPAVEEQVSILRSVTATGGSTPAQLSTALRMSRPTISKLLSTLVHADLVERVPSAEDRRSVVIVATDRGARILSEFRRGRLEVLTEAIERLPERDRDILRVALPTMDGLLAVLDAMEDEPWTGADQAEA